MQKLTHTSHLWKIGGVEPRKDVWVIPVVQNGTEHVILVQRLGAKNKVSVHVVGGVAGGSPRVVTTHPIVKASCMGDTVMGIIHSMEFSRALWVRHWKVTHPGGSVTYHPYLWEALFVHMHSNPEVVDIDAILAHIS